MLLLRLVFACGRFFRPAEPEGGGSDIGGRAAPVASQAGSQESSGGGPPHLTIRE